MTEQKKQRFILIGFRCERPKDYAERLKAIAKWEDHTPPENAQLAGYQWGLKLPVTRDAWARGHVTAVLRALLLPEGTIVGWKEVFEPFAN